jgi:hypothetical protein
MVRPYNSGVDGNGNSNGNDVIGNGVDGFGNGVDGFGNIDGIEGFISDAFPAFKV